VCHPRGGAAGSALAAGRTAPPDAALSSTTMWNVLPTLAALDSDRREQIDQRRPPAPRVVELPRHPSENGWVYDRAA